MTKRDRVMLNLILGKKELFKSNGEHEMYLKFQKTIFEGKKEGLLIILASKNCYISVSLRTNIL